MAHRVSRDTGRGRTVRFTRTGHVARITLARPQHGNRVTPEMAAELAEACERCEDDACRVVLLAAAGRDFCRGVEERTEPWPFPAGSDFVAALARVTRPVVAAIRGRAEAEGFELALAADLRFIAPATRFSLPQVERGGLPRHGGTQRLPRILGIERSLRLILLGEALSAREAVALGLVVRIAANPDAAAARAVEALAARGPIALRFAKEAVRRSRDLTLDDGARFEHDLYALLETTADRAEGIRAFLDKRKPVFRGS